ncbi:MAG: hypothetical protein Aurels2KO_56730 [Aureliella sp.]
MKTQTNCRWIASTLLLALSLAPATVWAGLIEISNSDSGWYNESGRHQPTNTNYIAGWSKDPFPGAFHRNFFTFDLGTITGQVTSATIQLLANGIVLPSTYTLYDVQTPTEVLTAGGTGLVAIYEDLGDGAIFGSREVNRDLSGQVIEITLNTSAIAALNANRGTMFAFGGAVSPEERNYSVFGSTSFKESNRLVLNMAEVPTPSLLLLIITGLCVLRRCRALQVDGYRRHS